MGIIGRKQTQTNDPILVYAACLEAAQCVTFLIENVRACDLESCNDMGCFPLWGSMLYVNSGLKVSGLLLEARANVDAVSRPCTKLQIVYRAAGLKCWIDGEEANPALLVIMHLDRSSALHIAAINGNSGHVKQLLSARVDKEARTRTGCTALQ